MDEPEKQLVDLVVLSDRNKTGAKYYRKSLLIFILAMVVTLITVKVVPFNENDLMIKLFDIMLCFELIGLCYTLSLQYPIKEREWAEFKVDILDSFWVDCEDIDKYNKNGVHKIVRENETIECTVNGTTLRMLAKEVEESKHLEVYKVKVSYTGDRFKKIFNEVEEQYIVTNIVH